MSTLVEELSNCSDYFWEIQFTKYNQDFLIYLAKYFWSLLNSPYLIIRLHFCKSNVNKTVLGKEPPEIPPPDPKPNPITDLTLTLLLTRHGGLFSGGIFSWHQIKQFNQFLFNREIKTVICNYHTFKVKIYFPLTRVLKRKKKKLALIFFYCLGQETWLDGSWKLTCINQSRFYNFFHVGNSKTFNPNFQQ